MLDTKQQLTELEQHIESKLTEAGDLLAIIQSKKLYKPTHKSFSAYIKARWGNSYEWARLAIKDAKLLRQLAPMLNIKNAHQARALAKVESNLRPVVAQFLNEQPDKLTAASILEVAVVAKEIITTGHIEIGDDGQFPPKAIEAIGFQITEAAYERKRRQVEYIKMRREAKPIEEQISYAATTLCDLLDVPEDATVTITIKPSEEGRKVVSKNHKNFCEINSLHDESQKIQYVERVELVAPDGSIGVFMIPLRPDPLALKPSD